MKQLAFLFFVAMTISVSAENNDGIASHFTEIVDDRLDIRFFQDGPYCPDIYARGGDATRMLEAFSSMSNNVEEALSMLPTVLTNDIQRNAFLTMSAHSGTNVFLRVWDKLLDVAETNVVIVPPATVDSFCLAGTTPLDCYVVFFYADPQVHVLLERTRDLFPSNSQKRGWYDRTLSGEVESEMRTYLIDSGEGLPWFAQ